LEGRSWTVTTARPERIAQAIGSEAEEGRKKPLLKYAAKAIQSFGLGILRLLHRVKIARTG